MKRDNLLFTCVFRLPEGRQNCRLSYCAMGNIFKGYELTMQFCRTIKTRSFVTHAWSPTKSVVLFRTFKMFFRKFITTSSESSVTIILFSAKVASEIQTVMVIISRVKLKKKTTDFEFKSSLHPEHSFCYRMWQLARSDGSKPRAKGGGVVLFYFTLLAFLSSVISFFTQNKGGTPPGPSLDPLLTSVYNNTNYH